MRSFKRYFKWYCRSLFLLPSVMGCSTFLSSISMEHSLVFPRIWNKVGKEALEQKQPGPRHLENTECRPHIHVWSLFQRSCCLWHMCYDFQLSFWQGGAGTILVIENTRTLVSPNWKLGQNFRSEINVKVIVIMLVIFFLISFSAMVQ